MDTASPDEYSGSTAPRQGWRSVIACVAVATNQHPLWLIWIAKVGSSFKTGGDEVRSLRIPNSLSLVTSAPTEF